MAWEWRQVGNDLNLHGRQECNPRTDKKIARGERQGLHPEGLANCRPERASRDAITHCAGHY